jgi:hypothetical protein
MYKNGEVALERIVQLVNKCPKEFQEKCFEALLSGYVQLELASIKPAPQATQNPPIQHSPIQTPPVESQIPAPVLPRFKNSAKRMEIALEKLEALFDFSVDPFTLQAVTVPGKNIAEKARNVALLAAARSYFASGSWSADWQEVKSLCVDNNCYHSNNHQVNLRKGEGSIFKTVEAGKTIELSTNGIKEAEKMVKSLAEGA